MSIKTQIWRARTEMPRGWNGLLEVMILRWWWNELGQLQECRAGGREFQILDVPNAVHMNGTVSRLVLGDQHWTINNVKYFTVEWRQEAQRHVYLRWQCQLFETDLKRPLHPTRTASHRVAQWTGHVVEGEWTIHQPHTSLRSRLVFPRFHRRR